MSLQNLLKENNYELYCDTLNVNSFASDTIKTDNIEPITGNDITVTGNIILPDSLSLDRQIGSSTSYFSNLWCERLQGANAPVMVQNGIIGNDGADPLYVADNGLMFTDVAPVAPVTSYTLERYVEYSGQLTAQGAIPATPVNYKAEIIGSVVILKIQSFIVNANVAGSTAISMTGLPSLLIPNNNIVFQAYVNINNTNNASGVLIVQSNGTILLQPDTRGTVTYTNGVAAGFFSPTPESNYWFTFSYNLN